MATITPTPVGGVGNTYAILRASIDANLAALNADIATINGELDTKADLASPALSGIPTAPTAAAGTSTTQIATTAYVTSLVANTAPVMDGTADTGASLRYARQDHVHPTDTTRAPLANPTFTGAVLCGSSTGLGYTTGSGGTVTQATSKSTAVTLNKPRGDITMNAAALAAATVVSFTLNNSLIEATDTLLVVNSSVGTLGSYCFAAQCSAGSATIAVKNISAASLSQALVISFVLIKGVIA